MNFVFGPFTVMVGFCVTSFSSDSDRLIEEIILTAKHESRTLQSPDTGGVEFRMRFGDLTQASGLGQIDGSNPNRQGN